MPPQKHKQSKAGERERANSGERTGGMNSELEGADKWWRELVEGGRKGLGVVFRTFKETSLPNFSSLVLSLLWPHLFPKVYAGLTVPFHPRPSDGLPQYLLRRTGLPWALPQTSPDCFSPGLGSLRVQAKLILEIGRSACQEMRTGFHLAGVTRRSLPSACAASTAGASLCLSRVFWLFTRIFPLLRSAPLSYPSFHHTVNTCFFF